MPTDRPTTGVPADPRLVRHYRPSPDDPTLSMILDDGTPPSDGYWLYVTPSGYLIRVWREASFGRLVRGYRRSLCGEPLDLVLSVFGFWSLDEIPADGSGYWGPGDAQVDDRAIRCFEAAGLLVPYH